jgi:hypothetical protein
MWQHYRKTFVGMQMLIWAVAIAALFFFGPMPATLFFIVMQISAVMGAVWAARLSAMVQRRATNLPLGPAR